MNFNKFINSDYLKSNPLCGIVTYKDTLNLATGVCTRRIRKLVLTGEETGWSKWNNNVQHSWKLPITLSQDISGVSSHYIPISASEIDIKTGVYVRASYTVIITDLSYSDLDNFKAFLRQQYAAGTPVTIWYVLATPTTETITVPSGLSGTEEGYLIQNGTPTPTNPIYPTANTVEQWFDLNHYIHNTSTDTITTLPAVIYPTGTTATAGLKGNTVQNGTPTPTTPIMPQGTGERTDNLFDKTNSNIGHYLKRDGSIAQNASFSITDFIPVNTRYYTLNSNIVLGGEASYCTYNANKEYISGKSYDLNTTILMDLSSNVKYLRLSYPNGDNEIMLNLGSPPLPYEPYGYKIPISSANTTTPVYLGEVQTMRKIRKRVLIGGDDENWNINTSGSLPFFFVPLSDVAISGTEVICTHYSNADIRQSTVEIGIGLAGNAQIRVRPDNPSSYTLNTWKEWLAQQYANGTPFTVYYTLATEGTSIVNEPLMKIGDYADTVSGITIPTITGKDTFDVDTTVQPSEVTVSYTGWHDATVKEWDGSQWNE